MIVKQQLYKQCLDFVENRLKTIQNGILEIQESLTSETKSSAGDKHETGRAMLQLEREKIGQQLAETQKLKEVLSKIDAAKVSESVLLGGVVYTTKSNYFIAISAGELQVEKDNFYAISVNTPIAQLLMGKKEGDSINFRGTNFEVLKVM
ncbi:GreA/GreB family elongation factor [Oceanihabitans sediminis]|nr:GreA/GreB family elongation factor [Oceanihabitans sediminis]MDX1277339.1 GreA/GreB family elongation factor [Oceanihabitans sediminis]MDX1773051.1 GreA/GreB family elongation factor [Oceanihabitans sediminis]